MADEKPNGRDPFEVWRDRVLSLAVPIFLGYLALRDVSRDGKVDSAWLIPVLFAYGAGLGAYAVKRLFR